MEEVNERSEEGWNKKNSEEKHYESQKSGYFCLILAGSLENVGSYSMELPTANAAYFYTSIALAKHSQLKLSENAWKLLPSAQPIIHHAPPKKASVNMIHRIP